MSLRLKEVGTEISDGIHQLKVPIPNNPLGYLNAYLVKSQEGCLLVDTGWNTDEAFNALVQQLEEIVVSWDDLRYVVITHAHPDHYGLAGRLVKHTKAKLVMHRIEQSFVQSRYVNYEPLLDEMEHWLRINGVPAESRTSLLQASMAVLGLVTVAMPDWVVYGGEHLRFGGFDFEILWTPGHSPGHICLYEWTRHIFLSGDHVLPKITPNVSMHTQSIGNPLADYLNSLRHVGDLLTDLVLPAHEYVFSDLRNRVDEIEKHHADREQIIVAALADGAKTAYQIASMIPWSTNGVSWNDLSPVVKRMTVTETLAHLELLFNGKTLIKDLRDGIVWYAVNSRTS